MTLGNDNDNYHKNYISMSLTHWHLWNVVGIFKLWYIYMCVRVRVIVCVRVRVHVRVCVCV